MPSRAIHSYDVVVRIGGLTLTMHNAGNLPLDEVSQCLTTALDYFWTQALALHSATDHGEK